MRKIKTKSLAILFTVLIFLTGCSTRAKFRSYDKQLDDIRSDVRSIRLITDQMRNELVTLKTSVDVVGDNIGKQSKDIDVAKKNQQLLSESLDAMKDIVVKLESKTIPEKKEEIKEFEKELEQVIVAKKENGVTKVGPVLPAGRKYISGPEIDTSKRGFGYAVKDGVILWRAPSKNSDVMEILIAWQQVTILGSVKNEGESWLQVKTSDYTGFADSKFIIASE